MARAEITEILDTKVGDQRHHVMLKLSVEPSLEWNFHHVQLIHTKENNLAEIRRNHLNAIENGIKSSLAAGKKIFHFLLSIFHLIIMLVMLLC